jgi:hypothetical protein
MRSGILVAPVEDILGNARYFPAQVDLGRDRLILLQTSRPRLAQAPFLDGRTNIAEGHALEVRLSDALAAAWPRPRVADRYIFHVAFCGSTLLASLLDVPGSSFVQREPNVLVDLAEASKSENRERLGPALELVCALLRRPWRSGEHSVCKPSNWVNSLLPALTAPHRDIRPLFIASDQRRYLHALFRGGRARMEFVVRAADHLLQSTGSTSDLWHRASTGVSDPNELPARIALLLLHMQVQLFDEAMRRAVGEAPRRSRSKISSVTRSRPAAWRVTRSTSTSHKARSSAP